MPSVSESSAADLTAGDVTAAVTGASTFSEFERENVNNAAGAVQNETSTADNNTGGQDGTTMEEGNNGNQNEAIIAILEDWAAWERRLEKEAEKSEVARDIKDIADEPAPWIENDALQHDPKKSSQCIVTEFDDNAPVQITPIPRKGVRSAPNPLRATTGQLYPSRRDRRRAERNDPVARTRREALKVWTADQTRRRSSAGDLGLAHGQVEPGLTLKDWVARRRSSAEATVDQARNGERSRQDQQWKGRAAGPVHMSTPPGSRHQHAKKSSTATDKTVSRWRDPHPGGGGRGRHEKPRRAAHDGIEVWEGEERTAPPTPRTPGSIIAGRASPWARSPSRETAGGILVKHCFFYGPAGKIALGRSPNTTPSFESHWMRKFREEVQGNPNWWAGPGQYRPGRSSDLSPRSVFRRASFSKRPAYPLRTGAPTSCEKGGASRNTNLWDEVRSLLARSRRDDGTNLAGGGSNRGSDAGGVATPEGVDTLSFGDRLRCTPLSQGAWLIDSAGGERSNGVGMGKRSSSVGSWRDAAVALAEKARGGSTKAPGRARASSEVLQAARLAVDQSPVGNNSHLRGKGSLRASECGSGTNREDIGNGGQRKSLQGVHEAILAKLRGKIDPLTREEIVLRAADDAKGALARDQAHASSPRRASAGVDRLPASGKEGPVPTPIDYDKVEATLSLIELASRAAGPDAGKQMLQALEGLDKIHQRVSDDEAVVTGEKRDCASEDKADLKAGSTRVEGGDNGVTMAEASGDTPRDDSTPSQKLPEDKRKSPAEVVGQDKDSQQRSRRISLAVSDVSEDSLGFTSTGVIQSVGNWLRRTDRPPSRQHSFIPATADMDGDSQQQVQGREGFPSPLSIDPEEHARGSLEARSAEETKSNEEGRKAEPPRARRVSVIAQQGGGVDGQTSLDGTSRVGIQATDDAQHGPGKTFPGKAQDERVTGAAADAVPTPPTILAAEPDRRTLERPIVTDSASQAEKAVSPGSPLSPRKAIDTEKSESPPGHTALRKKTETHRSRGVSPEKRRERTGKEKSYSITATARTLIEKVAAAQRVGFTLNDSCRHDSRMSLGTRPKRGGEVQEHTPVREGARAAASMKLFGEGRSRAKTTAATGTCAVAVGLRENLASGAPSKVCAKFVWPRPGRPVSGERLNLPEETSSKASSGKPPGIVRRSPLIDALHPAVAKQRAFRLTLRKEGQPGAPPPMATEETKTVPASKQLRTQQRQDSAEACGPSAAISTIAGKDSIRRRERKPLSMAPPTSPPPPVTQHSHPSPPPTGPQPPAVSRIAGKTSIRRRERKPLSMATPPSPPPSRPPTQHSHPSPPPTGPQPSVGDESGSGNETTSAGTGAPAVRLTAAQCECAEKWMEKAKYSLGPKVWECIGSSPAFYRIRDRFRNSFVQAGACETVDVNGRRPPGHATRVRGGESEKKTMETREARGEGVMFGPTSGKGEGRRVEAQNKADESSVSGWGGRLSQKAALIVDAIMWTIATERERSTVCAATLQDRRIRNGRPTISALAGGLEGGDTRGEGEGSAEALPTDATLAVSWLRARRFAKSSRLVDGVNVVDADVDLAFKRWEESEQDKRPAVVNTTNRTCSPSRSGPESPALGICTAGNSARSRSHDTAATPKMCDAVGCSEGGRYGDICPLEKSRFCRKHRNDGMVDLGGRRCERVDCGRLAARGSTLGSTRKGALCSLHTQEDRVDLEGLAFVLLALAETRQRGVRGLAALTAGTGTAGNNFSEMSGEAAADTAGLNTSAVRDLVLALTNQPLPSALTNVVHASSPGIETYDAFEPLKDAVQPSSVSRSTLAVAARSVKGAGVVASATGKSHRPNSSGRLSGDNRTSDQTVGPRGVLNSGEVCAANDHPSAVGAFSSPPVDRDPSATIRFRSQALPSGENESVFKVSCTAQREQDLQQHEAEAHGQGQPAAEKHGHESGEAKGDEYLERQDRSGRVRSSFADGGDDEFRELGPQSLNASRDGRGDCANRPSSTGTAWGGIRWRGVDEVLGRNARALKAVFRRYSRPSGGAREMALPDVLRFCDAFELRPGLVSTREIVDGFKEVIYPGVMGLTDEEIGYSAKLLERCPYSKPSRSGQSRQAASPPTGIGRVRVSRQNGGRMGRETVGPADPTADLVGSSCGAGVGGDGYSANFLSGAGGDDHVRGAPSHHTGASGGAGGRGKTVYLGRSQKFPLRRVESTMTSSDQDFGLTGGSTDSSGGGGFRRRASFRPSSLSRTGNHYLDKNSACDVMDAEREAKDPPVAPGLSLPQFFEWMSEVVVKCPAPVKTFGQAFARLPNEQRFGCWRNGRSGPFLASTAKAKGGSSASRQTAAKAVVMLQWMELSRGMRNGGIPPFILSSCFGGAAPPSVGYCDRR